MTSLPRARQGISVASVIATFVAAAIAGFTLYGWARNWERLKAFIPGLPVMNPTTAICLLATSIALFLLLPTANSKSRIIVGRVIAGLVLLLAGIKVLSLILAWDSPVDQWLFPTSLNAARIPSRIPVRSAISLFLCNSALLLLEVRTRRGVRPTEILSALVMIITFLALIGYSYGLITLYRTATYEPMSFQGAIAFLSLAIGTLLARRDAGAMRVIVSDTNAGLLARLLLPLTFLLPVLFGALRLAGENADWYTSRVGVALFATAFILFFFVAIGLTVRVLYRAEKERKAAQERVRHLNAVLEQRVSDRTAELRLLNQELVRSSQAKDDFLAVLSHELRTPLTPALAAAGYLADHAQLPLELREQARAIRSGVQLEARLIDDLLDLTRIKRGKVELNLRAVDAHEVIRKSLLIVGEEIRQAQLELVLQLDAQEHEIRADSVRLQQVFWNLLNNAVKFSTKGGRITVRSWNDAGRFVLEVSDTGAGISPELQERIFDAFEQGERATQRQFGGLGLGLTIAKKMLDLQGGTITAHSEGKDRGASFRVSLGLLASASSEPSEYCSVSFPDGRGLDLLLVEDHAQTLQVLSGLLRRRGHRVATAASVQSALQQLEKAKFDVLISDIGLPDGSGHDVMRAAQRAQVLPGIALSGFGREEDIRRSKEAGFSYCLTKPVDFRDLETCLGKVVS